MNEQIQIFIDQLDRNIEANTKALEGLRDGTLSIRKACALTNMTHTGTKAYLIARLEAKRKQDIEFRA